MGRLKILALRMLFLPGWLTALIALPTFALLVYIFAAGLEHSMAGYICYPLSAYSLAIVAVQMPRLTRRMRSAVHADPRVQRIMAAPNVERLVEDPLYRAEIGLYAGLMINLLYTALHLLSFLRSHSFWSGALAGYYLVLSVLRFALSNHVHNNPAGAYPASEWKRCRLCGWVLLAMNMALAAVVFFVVVRNSGFHYPGVLIYAMAAYAIWHVVVSVRNLFRFRRKGSPVLSAAKAVSCISALVSLLALETAMLARFGGTESALLRRSVTGITGGVICVCVLAMAAYMILSAGRNLRILSGKERSHG